MDTSVSDDNWGTHGAIVFLAVATLITDMLFKQFLIHTAVQWGEPSKQRTVMDTSLSDIIEARAIYDAECVVSQLLILQKKLTNKYI